MRAERLFAFLAITFAALAAATSWAADDAGAPQAGRNPPPLR